MKIREFERGVKDFLRSYNKRAAKDATLPESGVYDYDKLMESLSYVVKTVKRLERVSTKRYGRSR